VTQPTFILPAPQGIPGPCVWDGTAFRAGSQSFGVLPYDAGDSGWTDDLTSFHEAAAGENHYIDVASRAHALGEIKRLVRNPNPTIMDIGCSSGFMLKALKRAVPGAFIVGADYVRGPLEALSKTLPGMPLIQFNLVKCPLPDAMFDAVVLLNVFEHIEEDREAMRQTCRILKPGGIAVIEVPAGPQLYDVYDKQLMHFRRYRLNELTASLASAGFEILKQSHLGFFLYPPFWLTKMRNKRHMDASAEAQREIIGKNIQSGRGSSFMHKLMDAELTLGRSVSYPTGIRCLATCRKPLQRV
jgi:SAM-dependent methyltransferase